MVEVNSLEFRILDFPFLLSSLEFYFPPGTQEYNDRATRHQLSNNVLGIFTFILHRLRVMEKSTVDSVARVMIVSQDKMYPPSAIQCLQTTQ